MTMESIIEIVSGFKLAHLPYDQKPPCSQLLKNAANPFWACDELTSPPILDSI